MADLNASGIYCIEHVQSGKRYVGSAVNFQKRFKKHLRELAKGTHHSVKLQAAWNKYGEGAFEICVLLRCPREELLQREQEAIDAHDAVNSGFNVARFADAPHRGKQHSEATRAKMSASQQKRKPISEETRLKLREAAAKREAEKRANGYVVSEETRKKLSETGKGRVFSEEAIERRAAAHRGTKRSEETRRKLSEALSGRRLSDEHKAAISAGNSRRHAARRAAAND